MWWTLPALTAWALLATGRFEVLLGEPVQLRVASPRMQSGIFELVDDMPGGKASARLESYKARIETIRAE